MSKVNYYISNSEFVIDNYNQAPTFSSFFPGIAGIFGCPMWVFYANRGQCITSAGVQNKDGAIIEFQPANKAYRDVGLFGWRTFLKVDGQYYEPFRENTPFPHEMRISPDALVISETNPELKIKTEVTYFTIPNEQVPALARQVKITNLSNTGKTIEVIDGLPAIVPYGFNNDLLKRISYTIGSWIVIENLEGKAPYYKLKVKPADVSATELVKKGHFYIPFTKQGLLQPIVDPALIFSESNGLESPLSFIEAKNYQVPKKQLTTGFTPAAMAYEKITLAKKAEFELFSIIGQAESLDQLNQLKTKMAKKQYIVEKRAANKKLIDDIGDFQATSSALPNFDLYAKQTFLDNTMRGGLPVKFDHKMMYLYYRKHGDMERDYNDFQLMPCYFSQGNANYRDINQNRRNDIFFNPEVAEDNIIRFFNLIQLDGFNPLLVLSSRYSLKSLKEAEKLVAKHIKNPDACLNTCLTQPFLFGCLIKGLDDAETEYKTTREKFATELLNLAEVHDDAVHCEGFWIDHFSYNTDLLESYACIYPDRLKDLLLNKKIFTYFNNDHVVRPRKDKYHLVEDNKVRQNESVIANSDLPPNQVKTTLMGKILCLIANKSASFDAEGIGLEMEAEKPDWYDALNGLPALFGSSLSETLELKRLAEYALNNLPANAAIELPVEIKDFLEAVNHQLKGFLKDQNAFTYWDETYKLKEEYRAAIQAGLGGKEETLSGQSAKQFLANVVNKCNCGIKKCLKKYKTYCTYFINEVVNFELGDDNQVIVKKFKQTALPLFLEGFVHALKVEQDKKIYPLVKKSPLFDKKLKMYKVNSSLAKAPIEIGRTKIFAPGWLENESVWLHMEYKYLLELLKAGLYKEFFSDIKTALVPFIDPKIYKRSILENSSFIASSAHPNQGFHGRGFYARLSGASAEFIEMWLIMMTGKEIFYLDKSGKLCFKLDPKLPSWLFKNGQLSFKLLGSIDVTYVNKKGKNTYAGLKPTSYKLTLNKETKIIKAPFIKEPYAQLIRDRKVKKIEVVLA
ncbi:MAG: cellobiose phosphorylase [bacterium]